MFPAAPVTSRPSAPPWAAGRIDSAGGRCHLGGYPGGASGEEPACQCRRRKRLEFDPWVGKIPWRRKQQPTPVLLPGESHAQRSLAGCSLWGHGGSDATERTHVTWASTWEALNHYVPCCLHLVRLGQSAGGETGLERGGVIPGISQGSTPTPEPAARPLTVASGHRAPLLPPSWWGLWASVSQTQECLQASSQLDGSSPARADRASTHPRTAQLISSPLSPNEQHPPPLLVWAKLVQKEPHLM